MGHNSAEYIHHLAEAMRRAFRDRAQHVADVDFADVPRQRLTSKEYAAAPRLHHQWLPDRIRIESGGVSVATAERLRRLGHTVSVGGSQGIAHSIMIDPETGDRLGAADARNVDAVAVGN